MQDGPRPDRAARGRGATLALAGGSALVALLLFEAGLRLFFSAATPIAAHYPFGPGIAGSDFRFAQSEYAVRLRYNRYGFRDEAFAPEKSAGETRILCLGDSFVEGHGVEERNRFSEILERELERRTGRRHRVLNAGQLGTGPRHYLQNLARFGVALRPDRVILGIYVGNDFFGSRGLRELEVSVTDELPPPPGPGSGATGLLALGYTRVGLRQLLNGGGSGLYRSLRGRSLWEAVYGAPIDAEFYREKLRDWEFEPEEIDAALSRMDSELVSEFYAGRLNPTFLVEALIRVGVERRGDGTAGPADAETSEGREAPYSRADVDGVLHVVRRAHGILSKRDVELLVLVIPDVKQVHPREHRAFMERLGVPPPPRTDLLPELRRTFVRRLESRGIAHVDLTSALRAAEGATYHVMDGHWNEAGHRIAAEALLRELASAHGDRSVGAAGAR